MRQPWNKARFWAPCMLLLLGGCASELKGEMMNGGGVNPDGSPADTYQALTITNPENGAYYPSELVVVQGYSEVDGEILVNGESTTAEDGMYSHTLRLREEGDHQIVVEAPEIGAMRTIEITLDTISPTFTLSKPEPGSFINSTTIEIEGQVVDANVDFITINDRDYGVRSDGSFVGEASVHKGAHHWRVEAGDLAGNITPGSVSFLAGDFSTNGARTEEGVSLELGNDMIDAIGDFVRPEITTARLRPLLMANNPVISDWYGSVSLTGYSHTGVAVSVLPRDGYLSIAVSIGGLRVPFSFNHALGGAITGSATSTAVSATARIYLGVDGAGRPTATIRNINTVLVGFKIDVRDWPPEVDDLVTAQLGGVIKDAVTDILKSQAPQAVRKALAGLPMDTDFELLGHAGRATGRVNQLSVSDTGLFAVVDLGIKANAPAPSLAAKSGPFVLGHDTPTPVGTRDAHARVALDLVNRVAHAAWTTGEAKLLMESPVLPAKTEGEEDTQITVGSLAFLFPSIKGMAEDELEVDVELEAALPPIVSGDGEQISVMAPDVRAKVIAKNGDQRTLLFTLSVMAKADVDFSLSGSRLSASIANYEVQIDALGEVPEGFQSGAELEELFTSLIEPRIEPFLQLDPIDIPELTGYSLSASQATLSGGYIEASGSLSNR